VPELQSSNSSCASARLPYLHWVLQTWEVEPSVPELRVVEPSVRQLREVEPSVPELRVLEASVGELGVWGPWASGWVASPWGPFAMEASSQVP